MPNTSSSVFGHGRPPQGPGSKPNNQPIEATHLGQNVVYKTTYDPSLLVAVPRQENRDHLDIKADSLPFVGVDVWNAYEVSCLSFNGCPIVGFAKIIYSSDSPSIVESKSIKLYLNSFNMTPIGVEGDTNVDIRDKLAHIISRDLSNLLEIDVDCSVFSPRGSKSSISSVLSDDIISSNTTCLEAIVGPELHLGEFEYNENPNILVTEDSTDTVNITGFYSNLLRSNCKVTHQPDWGTIFIHYRSKKEITADSLTRYVISFRNENHFHEEICETVYKRLLDTLEPEELVVACFYTRRGGIDINPIRSLKQDTLDMIYSDYIDVNQPSFKTRRQ